MVDPQKLADLKADRGRLEAEIETAGGKVRRTAVNCPFHDDKHASGSIHRHDDGAWLYTCHACSWNGNENTGDIVDVVRRANDCGFTQAAEHLGLKTTGKRAQKAVKSSHAVRGEFDPAMAAQAACTTLIREPSALAHLWRTRGIDEATAQRFHVGITGAPGKRYWTFPIADATGRVVAVKHHRADGQAQKSFWKPSGVARDHLFPLHLEPTGRVWVCPGELKALAVVASGRAAIGITSGEGCFNGQVKRPTDLPARALELLRGRLVAVSPDADDGGPVWAEHVWKQLAAASIDGRIVRLPLDADSGLKDIGDYIVRLHEDGKDAGAVAASLDEAWRLADPWHGTLIGHRWRDPRTWRPVELVTTGLWDLDATLNGGLRTRGVHMICGKTGQAKTQFAVTIAVNAAHAGIAVGYLSLELGADEVAQLVAAQLADVPRTILTRGKVRGEYGQRFQAAMKKHHGMPLTILDDDHWPAGLTRDTLGKLIASGVKRRKWRVVVLDYLGLLVPPREERDQFTTDLMNSTELRKLAREHDIAFIVVASVRKGATFKAADKLAIDDLAGAGRLVYDAQNVFAIWCKCGGRRTGIVYVRPLKMRFAPAISGHLQFRWYPPTGRIEDLLEEEAPEATCRSNNKKTQ